MTCRLVVGLCRIPHRAAAAAAAHTHGRLHATTSSTEKGCREREPSSAWLLLRHLLLLGPLRRHHRGPTGEATAEAPPRTPPPPSFVVVAATASASLHIIHPRATREGSQRNRGWWADLRRLQQWQQQPSLLFPPFYHHYPGERARERERPGGKGVRLSRERREPRVCCVDRREFHFCRQVLLFSPREPTANTVCWHNH